MNDAGRHFEEDSAVFKALHKITSRLHQLEIPYALAGGMALFMHGYQRFTDDVDLLVTRSDLAKIHTALDGLGYLPPFAQSRNLRDTEFGVRIEFLIAGEYPGDGKPKPVAFPDPATAHVDRDGIAYLALPRIIELKLASGMTNPGRLRDLADVLELIRMCHLELEWTRELHPYVHEKYRELWRVAQDSSSHEQGASHGE